MSMDEYIISSDSIFYDKNESNTTLWVKKMLIKTKLYFLNNMRSFNRRFSWTSYLESKPDAHPEICLESLHSIHFSDLLDSHISDRMAMAAMKQLPGMARGKLSRKESFSLGFHPCLLKKRKKLCKFCFKMTSANCQNLYSSEFPQFLFQHDLTSQCTPHRGGRPSSSTGRWSWCRRPPRRSPRPSDSWPGSSRAPWRCSSGTRPLRSVQRAEVPVCVT